MNSTVQNTMTWDGERKKVRQADRQTDRQMETETETEVERERRKEREKEREGEKKSIDRCEKKRTLKLIGHLQRLGEDFIDYCQLKLMRCFQSRNYS